MPQAKLGLVLKFQKFLPRRPSSGVAHEENRSESDRSVGVYKSKFLARLMRCAGHMHSLGMTVNICVTTRGIFTGKKNIELARS